MATRDKRYGPLEGVDAASSGDRRLQGATVRQTGFDAPARKAKEKPHTVTIREAAGKVADWVNAQNSKKSKKKGK